jgi:hypothetical protein
MHPIGGWPSGRTACCSPSRNQQRRSRHRSPARRAGAILRPTTTTTPPPSSTSIRALTPAASTTAADGRPRRARARQRRRTQRVESDIGDRHQPARATPSSARRPDRLAFYMGYRANRRKDRVSRGHPRARRSDVAGRGRQLTSGAGGPSGRPGGLEQARSCAGASRPDERSFEEERARPMRPVVVREQASGGHWLRRSVVVRCGRPRRSRVASRNCCKSPKSRQGNGVGSPKS